MRMPSRSGVHFIPCHQNRPIPIPPYYATVLACNPRPPLRNVITTIRSVQELAMGSLTNLGLIDDTTGGRDDTAHQTSGTVGACHPSQQELSANEYFASPPLVLLLTAVANNPDPCFVPPIFPEPRDCCTSHSFSSYPWALLPRPALTKQRPLVVFGSRGLPSLPGHLHVLKAPDYSRTCPYSTTDGIPVVANSTP